MKENAVYNNGNEYSDHDHKHDRNDWRQRGHEFRGDQDVAILTSGTTTVSDQSPDDTAYIFAGTSPTNMPTLAFIGNTGATNTYSVSSLTEHGTGGTKAYGSVDVGYRAQVEVTNGVHIANGALDFTQGPGSEVTLDGDSTINNGGTLYDEGFGAHFGAAFVINGTVTVGANGSNNLNLGDVSGIGGTGTIRQTGRNDLTEISGSASGLHFDIRTGELLISSSYGHFDGTIGPTNGFGPALGPSADVKFGLTGFAASSLKSVTFDTSTGVLSLIGPSGFVPVDIHFAGNARGLNVGFAGPYDLSITDHPGSVSPIPITFT